jgi:hypothetical protein
MDGILEQLLRLEDAKHHALLEADAVAYDDYVRKQTGLINNPRISCEAQLFPGKMLELSRLANDNSRVFLSERRYAK